MHQMSRLCQKIEVPILTIVNINTINWITASVFPLQYRQFLSVTNSGNNKVNNNAYCIPIDRNCVTKEHYHPVPSAYVSHFSNCVQMSFHVNYLHSVVFIRKLWSCNVLNNFRGNGNRMNLKLGLTFFWINCYKLHTKAGQAMCF